ncbi:unnamed protein product, partial [Didymodactylos carnosus]
MTNNQIRPSNSPWSSSVILHKKKDCGIRFLVDYPKLHSVTKKDSFPQPTTEELLQRLGDNRYFTKLDLKSGYFQIPILEQDKEKTAFVTQDGLWEFNALPQAVMNGPPTFQRVMHNLIDRILPSPEKTRAIVELSPLHTLNEANEFMGKLNWYRKFIPHFAEIAAPIHKVTNKTKKTKHEFHWHD